MKRLDQHLVDHLQVPSRSRAKLLIEEGKVTWNGVTITKAGKLVSAQDQITIQEYEKIFYVGRGLHKIEKALEVFQIDVKYKIIADIGASTGGFTQYVLSQGAKRCYAIDVGHGQLAEVLRQDPRVVNMEGTNIRDLEARSLPERVDLCVVDLSFISLRLVLHNIFSLMTARDESRAEPQIIALFKPQFEVGSKALNKQGVVKDDKVIEEALGDFKIWCAKEKILIKNFTSSPIEGKKGNREFFFHLSA